MSLLIDPSTGDPVESPIAPVIDWPTGKPHTSYSEISTWVECSYRHYLTYVKKVSLDERMSPHPDFGKGLHAAAEHYLKTREMDKTIAFKIIEQSWIDNGDVFTSGPFPSWAKDKKGGNTFGVIDDWLKMADNILERLPSWLDEVFPNWEYVQAEEKLYEMIKGQPINFKGFVDGIIKVKIKNKYVYWIIDWKTCGSGWRSEKKRDFNVQLQLILYKHFWSEKHDIPLSQIRCGFVLMKRDVKKPDKALDIIPVSVGPKTVMRGLKVLNNHAKLVKKGFNLKNRNSCTFCEYNGTEHCRIDL